MASGTSRDTAFAVHSPIESISKDAWLSHYAMADKERFNLWLFVTGAYHVNGKNECIRKVAYHTDTQYLLLAHAEPIPPWMAVEARKSQADLVFCGKHVWMDVKKVSRLAPPWFGPEWASCYDYLKKKAEDAGLTTATLELDHWVRPEGNDFCLDIKEQSPDTVDILLPCSWDSIPLRFWSCLATMDMARVARILISGEDDVVAARNALVDAHLKGKSGSSIFFDVDMVFPQSTVSYLASHNKPIIGGAYYQRQFPYYPHLYENVGNYEQPRTKRIVALAPVMEVDSLGTGCLLVKREVYEKMGPTPFILRYTPIDNLVGEDIDFCLKARGLGYKIIADTTLEIAHIGNLLVTPAEAQKYQAHWRPM